MFGSSFIPVMVAIFVAMKKRKLIRRFKNSGTTSERNAKTLAVLGINRRLFFNRMLKHGVIIHVNGKYYLDEQKLSEYNNNRRLIIIPLIILVLVLLVFLDIYLS